MILLIFLVSNGWFITQTFTVLMIHGYNELNIDGPIEFVLTEFDYKSNIFLASSWRGFHQLTKSNNNAFFLKKIDGAFDETIENSLFDIFVSDE